MKCLEKIPLMFLDVNVNNFLKKIFKPKGNVTVLRHVQGIHRILISYLIV